MLDAPPTLILRHADGRDERLDREALLARVAAGGLAEGARVQQDPHGPWQQLARWYLDNSEIHALPDPEDTAYVRGHVAGVISQDALRQLLGVRADADFIDFNHDITVAPDPIVVPRWGRGGVDPSLCHRPIPVPTMSVEASDEVNAAIRVPSWGQPYDLHAEVSIPIPAWQDPAHAVFELPPLVTQSWRQVAVVGGTAAPKRARRRPRSVALPDVPSLVWVEPGDAPAEAARPAPATRTGGRRDRPTPAPPAPPAPHERATSAASGDDEAALRKRALKRVRRTMQARAKQGQKLSNDELRALLRSELAALRQERDARGDEPSRPSPDTPPPSSTPQQDRHGRHRPAARIQPATRLKAAPRVVPTPVPNPVRRANQPPSGAVAPGQTPTAQVSTAQRSNAQPSTTQTPDGETPWLKEERGWGCFGCFGQLAALASVALAVMIGLDIGAQRFVTSELGVALSGTDPELTASGRALRSPLIQTGPASSPVVAVLAADISTDAGAKLLRQTLAVLRPGRSRQDVPGSGKIRLVFLPAGEGPDADDTATTALVLDRMGVFWRQVERLDKGSFSAKRLTAGLSAEELTRLRKELEAPATLLQARTFGTMATGLGLDAPQMLVNGVKLHGAALRDRKAMEDVVGLLLTGAEKAYRATGRADTHYWEAMASVMQPRPRQRFLSWMIRGERVPTAPPKRPRVHPVAPPSKKTGAADKGAKKKRKAGPPHVAFTVPSHAPRLGPDDAAVKVVLFADMRCKFCRRLAPRLRKLRQDFGDDVQLAYLHYPLRKLHPQAEELAELAVIAHKRGRFWQLFDYVYAPGDAGRTPADVRTWMRTHVGAVRGEKSALRRARRVVRRDRRLGRKLKLRGTPTVFVNGWRVNGAVSYERLREVVLRELNKASGAANAPGGLPAATGAAAPKATPPASARPAPNAAP